MEVKYKAEVNRKNAWGLSSRPIKLPCFEKSSGAKSLVENAQYC